MKQKKKSNKIDWRVVVTGLICLTILECVALFNGIDGILLMSVIAAIALSIGVTIPSPLK